MKLFRALKTEGDTPIVSKEYAESAFIGSLLSNVVVGYETVMSIPTLCASLNLIADVVSNSNFHLYKRDGNNISKLCDYRCDLLNKTSNGTHKSDDLLRTMILDLLIYGSCYAHLKKEKNKINSIQYINPINVGVLNYTNNLLDPKYKLTVGGSEVDEYDFLIATKGKSLDGLSGEGLIDTSREIISSAYITMKTIKGQANGRKLKANAAEKLTKAAIEKFKVQIKEYLDADDGVIVLNKGIDIGQLGDNINQLAQIDAAIDRKLSWIAGVPESILNNTCTNDQYNNWIKNTIIPLINTLETMINDNMLLESEKASGYYFKADVNKLMRANQKERWEAYGVAIKYGIMSRAEVRALEDLTEVEGLDTFSYSLGDVIFDPKTGEFMILNMDSNNKFGGQKQKEGEIDGVKTA